MSSPLETYQLPSSPTFTCIDRFSLHPDPNVVEDANGQVPFWPILSSVLSLSITSAASLIDVLETISTTLIGTTAPANDHLLLRNVLEESPDFFPVVWPCVAKLALEMQVLFPDGHIPVLGRKMNEIRLSRRQVACLVAHQFLRTLRAPSWRDDGMHDFGIWYSMEQRQESAAKAYLLALMVYFREVVAKLEGERGWKLVFTLRSLKVEDLSDDGEECPLAEIEVEIVAEYNTLPRSLGLPGGAAVVAANKLVGFGQSATQEEVHVGISPEACPAVLMTPILDHDQALVVQGAQAMINITGKRRAIGAAATEAPEDGDGNWEERRMLFMDALELDLDSNSAGLPDLQPGNVDREIGKAYTAFCSGGFREVRTGLWGCGAFGADPVVKVLILWFAASLAGIKLTVVCDEEIRPVAEQLGVIISAVKRRLQNAAAIRRLLKDGPQGLRTHHQTALWYKERLGAT
ncbi:hypothetical protein QBC34DRAFT_54580 [Podospora aff. communis PSN243]|uniref:poly(ADP-ribose) glycohydrolase n=1 Tax=Podospora aff. communis PSN243 TaxID=3040156 RepID=A0AAV9GTQ4_9PEZI|nr:hypothetical protein QBC34DRAFT_54580 [Podospora aff. communis PSN243]